MSRPFAAAVVQTLALPLVLALGLALCGCGGGSTSPGSSGQEGTQGSAGMQGGESGVSLDRTVDMAGGFTFRASSSWEEKDTSFMGGFFGEGEYFFFLTGSGDLEIIYLSRVVDPYEYQEFSIGAYEWDDAVTEVRELSQRETTVNGASGVVFEYSYSHSEHGDMHVRNAIITERGSSVVVVYTAAENEFNSAYFDAVLESFIWE